MALESVVNADSSSSEFLKQSDTEKLANKFSSGSISKVDGEITQIIKGELEIKAAMTLNEMTDLINIFGGVLNDKYMIDE